MYCAFYVENREGMDISKLHDQVQNIRKTKEKKKRKTKAKPKIIS